jgi:hypothetical protein
MLLLTANIFQIADRKKGNIPAEVGKLGGLLPLDFPGPAVIVAFGATIVPPPIVITPNPPVTVAVALTTPVTAARLPAQYPSYTPIALLTSTALLEQYPPTQVFNQLDATGARSARQ